MNPSEFKFYQVSKKKDTQVSPKSELLMESTLIPKSVIGFTFRVPRKQQDINYVPHSNIVQKCHLISNNVKVKKRTDAIIKNSLDNKKYQLYSKHIDMCESI